MDQEEVLFRWIRSITNRRSQAKCVSDISRDGITLNTLIEAVFGIKQTTWLQYPQDGRERKRNIKTALDFLRNSEVDTCRLSTADICNPAKCQQTYILLENIFKFYLKNLIPKPELSHHLSAKETFREWINEQLHPTLQIHNFTDNWCSAKALAALVNSFLPVEFSDWQSWNESTTDSEHNLRQVMLKAYTDLNINQWLKPKDMSTANMKEMSNIIYLSQFLHAEQINGRNSIAGRSPSTNGPVPIRQHTSAASSGPNSPNANAWDDEDPEYRPHVHRTRAGTSKQNDQSAVYDEARPDAAMNRLTPSRSKISVKSRSDRSWANDSHDPINTNDSLIEPSSPHHISASQNSLADSTASLRNSESSSARRTATKSVTFQPKSELQVPQRDLRDIAFVPGACEADIWRQFPPKETNHWRTRLQNIILTGELLLLPTDHQGDDCVISKARFTHPHEGYRTVVAKTIPDGSSLQDVIDALSEAHMMQNFKHPNVLSLIGLSVETGRMYTLLPFLSEGDLHTYLVQNKKRLSPTDLNKFAVDIAEGMSYLHDPCGFVYRNLSMKHCLLDRVDGKLVVKLYDFAYARESLIEDYVIVSDAFLNNDSWRWLPPEILNPFTADVCQSAGFKVDVWSYAVVLIELYTYGEVPYESLGISTCPQLLVYLRQGRRLRQSQNMPEQMYTIAELCWKMEPKERPNFKIIEKYLKVPSGFGPAVKRLSTRQSRFCYEKLKESSSYVNDPDYEPEDFPGDIDQTHVKTM